MAIANVNRNQIQSIIGDHLTPSKEIQTIDRLFGRKHALTLIERALNSSGRQVFIYGDRGVGKTSVARTSARIFTQANIEPIYVVCSSEASFEDTILEIGKSVLSPEEKFSQVTSAMKTGLKTPILGGDFSPEIKQYRIPKPESINEAISIIKFVSDRLQSKVVIIIDEMERIESKTERMKFAEFIKNISTVDSKIKFIFCGITSDVNDLLNSHPSAGRVIESVYLEKINHSELWKIITTVSEKIGIGIEREMLIRISQISDGFPHFVHLIGDSLFWKAFDDANEVKKISITHYKGAISEAINRSEVLLRTIYSKATEKTKNTTDYEEALWSLSDSTSDRRQIQDIYQMSYRKMMLGRGDRPLLQRDEFNRRMLALSKESHGRIVVSHGSGWFSFRENIMRGYVRLKAEHNDVRLTNLGPVP
jgi:uncharacterized protein